MAKRERGVMQLIWKSFVSSLRPAMRHKLIGEDYCGTKYYEIPVPTNSTKKVYRYFVPVNKDDFDQELPTEWESWLRYRRRDPPSKEEIETNYEIAMTKKQNALQIKAKYSSSVSETSKLEVPKKGQQSFPTYEEYKNHGESYEIKKRPL
ncbi:NADH dehydrogenase [ubiquinone] 1 alpha subcomplex assembly factor 2 [Hylaeus volcanicus]|uniref:NADH dehydrogenase [ubiquinone] 1 alpha subcomplex assembly factor 2 n=1 Tax=Hylaeus volcanicus TaxID=313075 RepID=UPI0023B79B12|nr:NADH dehydrogenase [ubiquinone] 1 alpha subcomplex assembly factor 2 [Hylaeus volcanicus]